MNRFHPVKPASVYRINNIRPTKIILSELRERFRNEHINIRPILDGTSLLGEMHRSRMLGWNAYLEITKSGEMIVHTESKMKGSKDV